MFHQRRMPLSFHHCLAIVLVNALITERKSIKARRHLMSQFLYGHVKRCRLKSGPKAMERRRSKDIFSNLSDFRHARISIEGGRKSINNDNGIVSDSRWCREIWKMSHEASSTFLGQFAGGLVVGATQRSDEGPLEQPVISPTNTPSDGTLISTGIHGRTCGAR